MNNGFDERQVYWRGRIFAHGFYMMILLNLLHSFLAGVFEIRVVEDEWLGVIIVMVVVAACSMEMNARNVYFGFMQSKRQKLIVPIILGVCTLMMAAVLVMLVVRGSAEFIDAEGTLGSEGRTAVLMCCNAVIAGSSIWALRRQDKV